MGAFTSWLFGSFKDEELGEVFGCWVEKCGALEFCMIQYDGF